MQSPSPFTVPTAATVAATLERGARIAAPVICWVIAAFMTAAQLAYQCGYALGSAVHARNDQLAAMARRLANGERPTHQTVAVQPTSTPAPLPHPLAALRDELSALTVAELRRITGTRRQARKADLVTLALAMA